MMKMKYIEFNFYKTVRRNECMVQINSSRNTLDWPFSQFIISHSLRWCDKEDLVYQITSGMVKVEEYLWCSMLS